MVGYQAELIGNVSWTNATMWDMNSGNTTQLTALIPNTFNFNRAFDINNRGQIIVDTADGAIFIDGSNRTQLTPLPNQQGSSFTDLELNNIGSILNTSNITGTQSLFWSEATNNPAALGTVINGINDSIAMAGEHKFSGITHAALYQNGTITDLGLGLSWATASTALDLNNNGQVIALGVGERGGSRGFLWEDGNVKVLQSFDALSVPVAINELGLIVGFKEAQISPGDHFLLQTYAVIWDGHNQYDLNDLLDDVTRDAGWVMVSANDINDHGVVVGQAVNRFTNETHAYAFDTAGQISPIPEPLTYLMLLVGLGLIAVRKFIQ